MIWDILSPDGMGVVSISMWYTPTFPIEQQGVTTFPGLHHLYVCRFVHGVYRYTSKLRVNY